MVTVTTLGFAAPACGGCIMVTVSVLTAGGAPAARVPAAVTVDVTVTV